MELTDKQVKDISKFLSELRLEKYNAKSYYKKKIAEEKATTVIATLAILGVTDEELCEKVF